MANIRVSIFEPRPREEMSRWGIYFAREDGSLCGSIGGAGKEEWRNVATREYGIGKEDGQEEGVLDWLCDCWWSCVERGGMRRLGRRGRVRGVCLYPFF